MRKKKFLLNTIIALLKQVVFVICGFVLPKYVLEYYGSSVNGLVASITQFLGFISFLEMGVGPVIQTNLYKPLADKNSKEISKIVKSAERFFKKIAAVFAAYIIILIVVLPTALGSDFSSWFTASLIMIISISTFAQYYFGITYQLLLNADQRSYVQMALQTATILINTITSVILMKSGFSIQAVKLATAMIYLLRPIGQIFYVHKHYEIDKKIEYSGEPIKQKWNGFAQHLASVVVANTDITVLSVFSTLQNISIYSVYYNVVNGISNTFMTLVAGLESLWGNMIVKNETKRLNETFEIVEWVVHSGCTFLFTVTGILIVPFIRVYTDGIKDADYVVPMFGMLLVMAYGMECLRIPYFRIIKAAGHYRETQAGAFIQMIINMILSVALVFKFDMSGVAVGTLIAMFYHTTYFAWYLRKNILKRKFSHYMKHLAADALAAAGSVLAASWIILESISYLSWLAMAVKVGIICALTSFAVNCVLYRKMIVRLIVLFKK